MGYEQPSTGINSTRDRGDYHAKKINHLIGDGGWVDVLFYSVTCAHR